MGEPRPAAGVEPGLLAAGLAMALLLMAFGALATLGGALLLRLLSGIRIMTAISQAAAAKAHLSEGDRIAYDKIGRAYV